jgi:REP-associated tyrosine transposase
MRSSTARLVQLAMPSHPFGRHVENLQLDPCPQESIRVAVPHRPRPAVAPKFPVHVIVRMRRGTWSLRSGRCFRVLRRAFAAARVRLGMRLCQFSVQGRHVHFLVEADEARSLGRAMKGLGVRMARALNRVMRKKGAVYADRYQAHVLRTPTEVGRALNYVLDHSTKLGQNRQGRDLCSSTTSAAALHLIVTARSWLLTIECAKRRLAPFGAS